MAKPTRRFQYQPRDPSTVKARSNQVLEKPKIDLITLKQILKYEPDTGKWTWIARRCGVTVGMNAGVRRLRGRLRIEINDKGYYAAVLDWFYMTGEWPTPEVDHINRDPSDDRWSNLRLITHSNNCVNKDYLTYSRKKHNLPRGVYKCRNKYQSFLKVDGIYKYLGVFNCPNKAHQAWLKACGPRADYLPQGVINND